MTRTLHRPARFHAGLALAGAVALLLPGCFNSSSRDAANLPGSGRAKFYLETAEWGRLVDVLDDNGLLVDRDVMIRENLQDQTGVYTLGLNPLTQSQTLTIHETSGTSAFDQLLDAALTGRAAVSTKGLESLPPFSMVARNGAIRLQFSEMVDPALVNSETIKVNVGDPPIVNQEVRYIVDNDVIGKDGKPKGVVIIDPTISRFDEAALGIPQNGVGFPASLDSVVANAVIRIPTKIDVDNGQFQVLRNLGHTHNLKPTPSDPVELSLGLDPIVIRAFRTGNENDLYNGFMQDRVRPNLVTELEVGISNVAGGGVQRTLTYAIDAASCRPITPKVGDVFEIGQGLVAITKVVNSSDPNAYVVSGAVLEGADSVPVGNYAGSPLGGRITTAYSSADAALQLCWVKFTPEPEYGLPARGIDPYSTISISFNEPIDPSTVKALETFVINSYVVDPVNPSDPEDLYLAEIYAARQFGYPNPELVSDYIDRQLGYTVAVAGGAVTGTSSGSGRILTGPLGIAPDGRTYTIAPAAGFSDSHDEGNDLRFAISIRDGDDGLFDLAGNKLAFTDFVAGNEGQQELITPGAYAPWPNDRYFALRFNSTDENGDSLLEYTGQYVFEPGVLRGRNLVRFSRNADPFNPFVAQRIQFSAGVMTPLTPAGAVLMTCWPYHILGLGLLAVSEFNLDVESMNWAPFGGNVIDDSFHEYSLALSHSQRSPDDYINPSSGYPQWPNSGLRRNADFTGSILGYPDIDETVTWSGEYQLTATKVFTSSSGNKYMPWGDFTEDFTYRDTDIPAKANLDGPAYLGGKAGPGVPPDTVGLGNKDFSAEYIPSIGLPLLARIRAYPRGNFYGANGFQVQIMCGSSALPAFRIFSAGGRNAGGTWFQVIPDDRASGGLDPQGGYNTATGAVTKGYGPELYWHQVDFVLRISRVYTHWFSFGGIPDFVSSLNQEPAPEFQPPNTEVVIDVRGAEVAENCGGDPSPLNDANELDFYGNYSDTGCGNLSDTTGWRSDILSLLNDPGGRDFKFFQFRFTFVSNIEQNLSPELDALGFAWSIQ